MKQTVAVFDFDGTLSSGECGLRFFQYLLGKKHFYGFILRNFFWNLLYLCKLRDEFALNKIISAVFKDKRLEEVAQIANNFSQEIMPRYLYEKMMQRLVWHQVQGHRCIIITRALDIYMQPWAQQVAINEMIATKLEVTGDGFFTGKIANHSFVGEKKLQALYELLGDPADYVVYAYADSDSDKYILAAADYAYWVCDPHAAIDKALVDHKTHNQWKIDCFKC
jgi:HAD superfamily hydrolase (TIGR01490 family)